MEKALIIGTGGLAREFTSWGVDYFQIIGYSSTNNSEYAEYNLPGKLYSNDITPDIVGTNTAILAIGTPSIKEKIYDKFLKLGFRFPFFIHPSSTVSDLVTIGDGVIISPQCVVSPNVMLGKLAYINFCCGIGHDAKIGDFSQINPGVQIGGFAKIGESVLIGSGSTVLQGVSIGDKSTVGSGSVVFSGVATGATVMGNPARRMRAFEE